MYDLNLTMKLFLKSVIVILTLFSCTDQQLEEETNEEDAKTDSTVQYDNGIIEKISYYENDRLTTEKLYNSKEKHFQTIYYSDTTDDFFYESYHENGVISESGTQGNFQSCGVPVGETRKHDTNGNLVSIETYEYFDEGSCHEMYIVTSLEKYEEGELRENLSLVINQEIAHAESS